MKRLIPALALLALAGCTSTEPNEEPERDFSKGNPPMMDEIKGRAEKLLGEGDQAFAERDYAEANAVYKLAASAAELEGNTSIEVEANAQVARCYSLEKAGKELGTPFLQRAGEKASPKEPRGWTRYLGVRGIFERERGESVKATATFKEMYSFAVEHELHDRALDAAHHVAIAAEPEEQVEWAKKAIASAEAAGKDGWLAVLWNNLGATYEDMKRYPECVEAYTKAREYHRKGSDPFRVLVADWAVAHGQRLNGQLDEAQPLLEQTLDAAAKLEKPGQASEWQGYCLQDLGEIAVARGNKQAGLEKLEAARVKWRESGLDKHWPDGFKKLEARIAELR